MTTRTLLILIAGLIAGLFLAPTHAPNCFEDQYVAWDGNEHTICLNIDDL